MADLARLLAQPGAEVHVLDLVGPGGRCGAAQGDLGDVLDDRARAAYRQRLHDLDERLADAEADGDDERPRPGHRGARVPGRRADRRLRPRRAARGVPATPPRRARTTVTSRIRDAHRPRRARAPRARPAPARVGAHRHVLLVRARAARRRGRSQSHIVRWDPTPEGCQHPLTKGQRHGLPADHHLRHRPLRGVRRAGARVVAGRTAGRRTGVGGQVFADRDRPGHYVALDWFDSYESAMVNSHLPATDAFAQQAAELATEGPVFHNLEPVDGRRGTPARRSSAPTLETLDRRAAHLRRRRRPRHARARTAGCGPRGRRRPRGGAARRGARAATSRCGTPTPTADGLRRRVRLPHARRPRRSGRGHHGGHRCSDGLIEPARHHLRRQLVGRDRGAVVAETGALGPRIARGVSDDHRGGRGHRRGDRAAVRLAARARWSWPPSTSAPGWACTTPWPRRAPPPGCAEARGHRRAVRPRVARAAGDQRAGRPWPSRATPTRRVYGLDPEQAASFGDPDRRRTPARWRC